MSVCNGTKVKITVIYLSRTQNCLGRVCTLIHFFFWLEFSVQAIYYIMIMTTSVTKELGIIFLVKNYWWCNIGFLWMRNFAKMTEKFHLTQRAQRALQWNFVANFRPVFARTKEIRRISLPFLLHGTVQLQEEECPIHADAFTSLTFCLL